MTVLVSTLQITFAILCFYVIVYSTGFIVDALPAIIDSFIYLIHYLKDLKDNSKK